MIPGVQAFSLPNGNFAMALNAAAKFAVDNDLCVVNPGLRPDCQEWLIKLHDAAYGRRASALQGRKLSFPIARSTGMVVRSFPRLAWPLNMPISENGKGTEASSRKPNELMPPRNS